MQDPIEQYLRDYADDGPVDSTGVFTISPEKAMEKLAAFQLPRASAWLLKMIQAGVAAGATSIGITHAVKTTTVSYTGAGFPSLSELIALWTDPTALLTPAQSHLTMALRSEGFARQRPILILHQPADLSGQRVLWTGSSMGQPRPLGLDGHVRLGFSSSDEGRISFYFGRSPLTDARLGKGRRGLDDAMAGEYREIAANAVVCPVPLSVDGRRIDHFGLGDRSLHRCPVSFGCQPCSGTEPGFGLSESARAAHNLASPAGLFRSAWTVYATDTPLPSVVCWIKDGVICQEETLEVGRDPFYLRLFLPAGDLQTDLSGLYVRFANDRQKPDRIAQALGDFRSSAPSLDATGMAAARGDSGSAVWWGAAALLGGGALLSTLTMGVGLLLGLASAAGLIMTNRSHRETYERALHARFQSWAAAVGQGRDRNSS